MESRKSQNPHCSRRRTPCLQHIRWPEEFIRTQLCLHDKKTCDESRTSLDTIFINDDKNKSVQKVFIISNICHLNVS